MKNNNISRTTKFTPALILTTLTLIGAAIGGVAYASTCNLDQPHTHASGWCHVVGCYCKGFEGNSNYDCKRCGHLYGSH